MAVAPADSLILQGLLGDDEMSGLFTDRAEIRAILLVWAALARVQAALGVIPAEAAEAIGRAALEAEIDPASLSEGAAKNAVLVPGLLKRFRPFCAEAGNFVHFGATSQDVVDTGLVLRLRRALDILRSRLVALDGALVEAASRNAATVMAARTWYQQATPTTLGAKIAVWRAPIARHIARLDAIAGRLLVVSLAGASGNSAALERPDETEAGLASELGLGVPDIPWHAARDNIAEFGAWLALVCGSLGKMGQDIVLLTQTEVAEISAGAGGGSSTMPHKANPVPASVLVANARMAGPLAGLLNTAQVAAHERDGTAWLIEWQVLPQLAVMTANSLQHSAELANSITARPDNMARNLASGGGLMMAEAATFALASHMPRTEAQSLVSAACTKAVAEGLNLRDALEKLSPVALDWADVLDPSRYLGRSGDIAWK